jgi:hypothetical protein
MSAVPECVWAPQSAFQSDFRGIEFAWDHLESVGHVAPFVAPVAESAQPPLTRGIMACMKKVVVYIPDNLLTEIDAEAVRTDASRSAVMRDLACAALRRRRVDRATEMQTLLHHTGPHGGNAAERVKQMRPRDPWVPSADLRRIRREAPADSGLYADLDVVRRAELEA